MHVLNLVEVGKGAVSLVGGKAANAGELLRSGFPMPEGFVVTVEAYNKFIEENNLKQQILEIINRTDMKNIAAVAEASLKIKSLVLNSKMPQTIKDSVISAYRDLTYGEAKAAGKALRFVMAGRDFPFVAVRSSATVEDIGKTSAAGQHESFLNVKGPENVCFSIQKCWASLFTPRAIYYRYKNSLESAPGIGVIVQRMIDSFSSGVMFTVDPATSADAIVIEAAWGLGETIVQGEVSPDRYVVDKITGKILERHTGFKPMQRIRDPVSGLTVKTEVTKEKAHAQVLSELQIQMLAAYGKKIEAHYGVPQDIEFAIEKDKIYIVQTRAVTTKSKIEEKEISGKALLSGLGASPGIASGIVKIVRDVNELSKIQEGDVLVTEMTNPDMVPAMEKSSAIVTDKGGTTSHAAIISRELGIPCVIATKNATQVLKEGKKVTVDANKGVIYAGEVIMPKPAEIKEIPKTKTKVKVNLAFAKTASPELAAKTDGIGLLRIEHMLTEEGLHPIEYFRRKKTYNYTAVLLKNIEAIAKIFYPKPVWVRCLDARTDEFRNMKGGYKEPKEANPMLGLHGIRRALDDAKILKAELRAVKILHQRGLNNVCVMLPFICDVSELRKAKDIAREIELPETVKLGIMVEVPSAALTIEDFCKEGIDFISFGTNDLTMLTLGVDRGNEKLIKLYNVFHPSVLKLMKMCIEVCRAYNVETSICGEAGSDEKMAEILVSYGIDSVSANIDAVDKIRIAVAQAEQNTSK